MRVDAQIDDKAIKALMKKMPGRVEKGSKKGLARAAAYVEFAIKKRTARGISVKGGMFTPYSDGYAKFRSEHGRGNRVDLNYTGRMLAAMHWKVKSAKEAVIFFVSGEEAKKAMYHHKMGAGRGKVVRPWFDINKAEVNQVRKLFGKRLHEYLRATP
tara:strand:- start:2207 stop:2677 length:471 start_codon:yes stop_codon:yes gene_type:complete